MLLVMQAPGNPFDLNRWMRSDMGQRMLNALRMQIGGTADAHSVVKGAGRATTWLHPQLAVLLAPMVSAESALALLQLIMG